MPNSPDVVVIGGGIIGCSTAYQLAKRGMKVTVVERESVGCEASGVATGMISVMSIEDPGPFLDLARASFELYKTLAPELREASGIDFYYGEASWLDLAFTEEEEEANRKAMSWKKDLVPRVTWLSDDDMRRVESRVSAQARSGVFFEGLAQVDAYRLTLAFTSAAESLGVVIRYAEATGLNTSGDRVSGVATSTGDVSCDAVVLAMGAWSGLIEPWIGIPVPVEPLKGQILKLRAPGPPLVGNLHLGSFYVTPKLDGSILAGGYDSKVGFDKRTRDEGTYRILGEVARICPPMQDAVLVEESTGLRPLTPDMFPILGPVPGLEGAFIATGHQRKGITLAAMTGKVMAQVVSGQDTELPIEAFSLARFGNGARNQGDE
ncbi:MAG: glycine oxidase ThiO [Chloroflexi bacterium]|nr:glycine oxidase ThiO [Chloroflexota bacterium]